MCIALLTTAHPQYSLILLSNRDEYVSRPTASASFWPSPYTHVLGGRDLFRSVQGTWLGITTTGRIAALTNFREEVTPPVAVVSRGEIIKNFLIGTETTDEFVRDVVGTGVARDAGGFSLVCGQVGKGRGNLAVISNRARSDEEVPWICGDVVQTVGLSNTHFGDQSWPKVVDGERGLLRLVREDLKRRQDGSVNEDEFINNCFELLSTDSLTNKGLKAEEGLETHVSQLRNTIFVPPLGTRGEKPNGENLKSDEIAGVTKDQSATSLTKQTIDKREGPGTSGIYGTQKQTIILIDHEKRVRFIEKTLFDNDCQPVIAGNGIVDTSFQIE